MERSRVLVVEDVRHLAHFVRRNLDKAGYETEVVHRGDEVTAAVRRFRPHALVLDMVLPGMSGLEVCRALRADPLNADLVVVIVTGHSFDDASADEVEAAGADWSFTKPLSPVNLLAKLDELGVPPLAREEVAPSTLESTLLGLLPEGVELSFRSEETEGARRYSPDLWICAPDGREDLLDLGESLAAAAERLVEAERERDGLSRELGLSYESLTSIYEIGSDPTLLLSPERALSRIIDRALAFEKDLHAVVWLLQDGRFVPAQWRNTERPLPRRPDAGVIGRALGERRGIIVNRRGGAEAGELARAQRIAVSPLICREQAIGALVVWHEAPGEFDSGLMGLLTALSSHAAMILEQDRLRQETVEGARLRKEAEIGGSIQKTLLFGSVPKDVPGAGLGTIAQASRQIDGDFFGFFRQADQVFDVLVGDVMGKGIPAAIVGAAVKSQFARFAANRHASGTTLPPATPGEIVTAVHGEVVQQLIEVGRFVTAVYARFDIAKAVMTYVDCGHPHTLQYRARARGVEFHSADPEGTVNLPLGVHPDTRYEEHAVPIGRGDVFLFYSDGVTETMVPSGAMFGADALANTVSECHHLPAQELAEAVRTVVTQFAAEDGLKDDLTCIVVEIDDERALEIAAEPGRLADVRAFVADICREIAGSPFDEDETARLQLGLVEATSNIVRHAYGPDEEGSIRIEASWDKDRLRFRLLDSGRAFEPSEVPDPCFEGSKDGGFGLYIIREVMDEVSYWRDARGRNCLELSRFLPGHKVKETTS